MSRCSRANPWWERCDILGHACPFCVSMVRRAYHLEAATIYPTLDPEKHELEPPHWLGAFLPMPQPPPTGDPPRYLVSRHQYNYLVELGVVSGPKIG